MPSMQAPAVSAAPAPAARQTTEDAASAKPSVKSRARRWLGASPFILIHLSLLAAIWTGVTWEAVAVGLGLFWLRTFAITAGYHRYFAHRTFKTSRVMQFVFAFLAQSSVQKGALWWAAHHRVHHKESDQPGDVHSPVQRGFWYAHVGWIFDDTEETRWDKIQDFARYPELRFLNKLYLLPPILMGFAVWAFLGWGGLVIGFFASTVLLWHSTFFINSLAHVYGSQRFETKDDSRNNWWLALLTFGEGWHNNHHHHQASVRQGFYWWEVDISYYILKAMSWVGLVWDLREPPPKILERGRALDRERRQGDEVPVESSERAAV